jgi:hypothetical protein
MSMNNIIVIQLAEIGIERMVAMGCEEVVLEAEVRCVYMYIYICIYINMIYIVFICV